MSSIDFINGANVTKHPSIGNTSYPGYRVISKQSNNAFVYDLSVVSDASNITPYNHYIALTSNSNNYYLEELIIAQGRYTSDPSRYIDYSLYDNPNYSAISANSQYKFATFAWRLQPSSAIYNKITFTIYGLNQNGLNEIVDNSNIKVFYRFQDGTNREYNSSNSNSVWINALTNGSAQDTLSSGNYYNYINTTNNNILFGHDTQNEHINSINNQDITLYCLAPAIKPAMTQLLPDGTGGTYLYCRICLDKSKPISFNYISATVTN